MARLSVRSLLLGAVVIGLLSGCARSSSSGPSVQEAPTPTTEATSTAPASAISVSEFLFAQGQGGGAVLVRGFIQKAGAVLELVDGERTLPVRLDHASAARIQPGDSVELSVSRTFIDNAYDATLARVVGTAPYADVLARIREAGVSISADPSHNQRFDQLLGTDTAAYLVGDRSETLIVAKAPSGQDASATIASIQGIRAPKANVVATFYLFRDGSRIIGYVGHGPRGAGVARKLTVVLGSPVAIPWAAK